MTQISNRMRRLLVSGTAAAVAIAGPVSVVGLAGGAAAHDRAGERTSYTGWTSSLTADDIDCTDLVAAREKLAEARRDTVLTRKALKRATRGSLVRRARAARMAERRQARRELRQARRELSQLRRTYSGSRTLARHGDYGDYGDYSGWRDDDDDDDREYDRDDRWGGLDSVDTDGMSQELRDAIAALRAAREALAKLNDSDRDQLRSIIRSLKAQRADRRENVREARRVLRELRRAYRACIESDDDGSTDGDDIITETPNDPADQTPLPDADVEKDANGDPLI